MFSKPGVSETATVNILMSTGTTMAKLIANFENHALNESNSRLKNKIKQQQLNASTFHSFSLFRYVVLYMEIQSATL